MVLLDHRIADGLSTRRCRIVKYRGSAHSGDEHPFLIDSDGIWILPITTRILDHDAPKERVSTGIPGLDELLGGKGYYRSASVLVTGTAGTGKSSLGASFAEAACRRGESAVYLAFEESRDQIVRNMESVGMDLSRWIEEGLLHFQARRPSQLGLEEHLLGLEKILNEVDPSVVVVDPISNLIQVGTETTTRAMLTRLVDVLKSRGITGLFTTLGAVDEAGGTEASSVSSLADTWIELRSPRGADRTGRSIRIIKSRGMKHDGDVHPLDITSDGLSIGRWVEAPESTGGGQRP